MKSNNLDLISVRRYFHANPELSGKEVNTAKKVADILRPFQPNELITRLGGHGVAAVFNGQSPGPTIMFRCELDALPIHEINEFEYRSKTSEVGHKCGHDGHMTILLGLAAKLSGNGVYAGRVVLLFQPSEENGEGAKAVLDDDRFVAIRPDYAFALHNLPGYPRHQVVYRRDTFTAAVNSIIFKLKGKTAHAGEPELGVNPALAISKILQAALALSNNAPDRADFSIVTPVYINLGKIAYGISAGEGELHLTIRTWTEENLQNLTAQLEEIARNESQMEGLHLQIEKTQHFNANENDDSAVDYLLKALSNTNYDVVQREYPFKWGEDFGLFTQKFKGAMFGIGAGTDCPALHNPDYDFPDEIIETGVEVFFKIQSTILGEQ